MLEQHSELSPLSPKALDGIRAGSNAIAGAVAGLCDEIMRLQGEVARLLAAGPQAEDDGTVYLRKTMRDWRLEQGMLEEADLPTHVRSEFDIRMLDRGDGAIEVQFGSLATAGLQRLAATFQVENGQPSVSIRGARLVPGHGKGVLDDTAHIDTDGAAQTLFVLPDGQLLSRAPTDALESVPADFLPGDAAPVLRQALAAEGFLPAGHDPSLARGVRFANVERYTKRVPLSGTRETLVLTIEIDDHLVVMLGGTEGEPAVARREQLVSPLEGVGSALGDVLQVTASVTSAVRDHVQRGENMERI